MQVRWTNVQMEEPSASTSRPLPRTRVKTPPTPQEVTTQTLGPKKPAFKYGRNREKSHLVGNPRERGFWESREQKEGVSGLWRTHGEHGGDAPATGEVTGREARGLCCKHSRRARGCAKEAG